MRILSVLLLLFFAGLLGLFAYQNQYNVTIRFLDRELVASMPLVAGVSFVAGMLGGWTIVGLLRRSVHRMVEPRRVSYR